MLFYIMHVFRCDCRRRSEYTDKCLVTSTAGVKQENVGLIWKMEHPLSMDDNNIWIGRNIKHRLVSTKKNERTVKTEILYPLRKPRNRPIKCLLGPYLPC